MKTEKIIANILLNKEVSKRIEKATYYDNERFIKDAQQYIKAIKERRMLCNIASVSKSGMSINIKFLSCEKGNKGYNYLNYNQFFDVLGYTKSRSNDFYFVINGWGVDMIFHTNYTIIHRLWRLGFLNKKEVKRLAQMTPVVI